MIISESILIEAPVKKVWNIFTDLTCWKDWSTVFSDVSYESDRLTEGENFKFCIRPFSFPLQIEPVVEEMLPEQRIVWSGSKHGIRARHEFLFAERNGKTLLTSREIFKLNWMKRLFFHIPRKRLHKLSVLMLQDLKYASENSFMPEKISESGLWEKKSR
jgi:ligand-binding SRPBCC domain-containing protein